MLKKISVAFVVLALALAAGCADSKKRRGGSRDGATSDTSGTPGRGADGAVEFGMDQGAAGLPKGISSSVVYFELDSSEIKASDMETVEQHAKYLAANPSVKVRLEGHCDERGSREYNIALGERRSQSVQQALLARGVSQGQLSLVSFGEERPVALGHDESAWTQNRRVEFIYP